MFETSQVTWAAVDLAYMQESLRNQDTIPSEEKKVKQAVLEYTNASEGWQIVSSDPDLTAFCSCCL